LAVSIASRLNELDRQMKMSRLLSRLNVAHGSDFRIILERTVEFILLQNVVARFRRDVMTKGKLRGVAKVTATDFDYIDQLMTTYSVYEHSQTDKRALPR